MDVREDVLVEVMMDLRRLRTKRYRRGGKRYTARKHKREELERQKRGEGDPEAGPSRPN